MAKGQKRTRRAPIEQSKAEQRARADEKRIRRELAAVRRVGLLSKQLEHAAARAEVATFQLGRQLVTEKGWAVVTGREIELLRDDNRRLTERCAELERLAAEEFNRRAVEPV